MRQILLGLLFMVAGGALMYWSYPLVEMFGRSAWAERNVGGTRNLILMIGFVLIIMGGLILFGVVPSGSPLDSVSDGFTTV